MLEAQVGWLRALVDDLREGRLTCVDAASFISERSMLSPCDVRARLHSTSSAADTPGRSTPDRTGMREVTGTHARKEEPECEGSHYSPAWPA